MRDYKNAPALKFLIRILTGMRTLKEWTVYYDSYREALRQTSSPCDKLNPPSVIKLGKYLTYATRHNENLIDKSNEKNAILRKTVAL